MFCKYCGKQLNDSVKFCKYCGGNLKGPHSHEYTEINDVQTTTYSPTQQKKKSFNPWGWVFAVVFLFIFIGVVSDGGTSSSNTDITYSDSGTDNKQKASSKPDYSLPNGTVLYKNTNYLTSEGQLKIRNGTSKDAVAKLIKGDVAIFTVYIKANSSYTISNISEGTYDLMFAQGKDWSVAKKQFNKDVSYSTFDDSFVFDITEDSQYYYYADYEVTLNAVVGGNAETSNISPSAFNMY